MLQSVAVLTNIEINGPKLIYVGEDIWMANNWVHFFMWKMPQAEIYASLKGVTFLTHPVRVHSKDIYI